MDEPKEIRYTSHAQRRMRQRNISASELEDVLRNFHTQYTDKDGNPIYIGHPGGRRIKVVVKKDSNHLVVITVGD